MQHSLHRALSFLLFLSSLAQAQTSNTYKQNNLISDGSVPAQIVDKTLINPWGVAIGQQTPFWINNAGSGTSAIYDASGNKQFAVKVPSSGADTGAGKPAGIVFNASATDFILNGDAPALFLFSGLDGTISAWNTSLTDAKRMVDNSGTGAVYTGLTIASNATDSFILAANMGTHAIDVFDTKFATVSLPGKFIDPTVPPGYAPFNVHALNGKIYVLYAMQTPGGGPPTPGPGAGFVSVFDTSGNFLKRAISNGSLNAPWGIALAPQGFGALGGDLLVGNFGDGTINAYDPNTFALVGQMQDASGKAIQNDRLWEIVFGQNGTGDPNTLYFSAGVNDEKGGLFGSITAAASAGAADFSVVAASPSVTVAQGGTGTINLSVTGANGFNGPVAFSASGVPAGMSAQFTPSSVTPSAGQAATTTLTIAPAAPTAPAPYRAILGRPGNMSRVFGATAMLPLGLLGFIPLWRRQQRRLALRAVAVGVLSLSGVALGLMGCGSSNAPTPASPPPALGTSVVIVTATSGALSHTATFSLTVQ